MDSIAEKINVETAQWKENTFEKIILWIQFI